MARASGSPPTAPARRRGCPAPATASGRASRRMASRLLEEPSQVHPGVEMRDLVRVAVEGEGRPPRELADPPLGGLAPARVIDGGVYVCVEAVLVRGGRAPRGGWLLGGETDLHDRLDPLEPVLPRHDQPQRCAILIG